jgi:hypothetical protein
MRRGVKVKDIARVLAGVILNNKKELNKIFNSNIPSSIFTLKAKKEIFRIIIERC